MRDPPQRLAVGHARWPQDRALVEGLIRDFAAWAGPRAGTGGPQVPLARLPGRYRMPHGCILVAHAGSDPVGVAAFRRRRVGVCEIDQLFVREAFRGLSIAGVLLDGLIATALAVGYRRMMVEVGDGCRAAREVYRKGGFQVVRSRAPRPGVVTLGLDLRAALPVVPPGIRSPAGIG
ncbi:MAG: GNAT family N-acetyltransferase [Rhodovulum sp.]|nr:GNAT family N-acetyltransferase [Rhodovulum sp.]